LASEVVGEVSSPAEIAVTVVERGLFEKSRSRSRSRARGRTRTDPGQSELPQGVKQAYFLSGTKVW
jgi:hypothetical protein